MALLCCIAVMSAEGAAPQWRNSSSYSRVIVNATQGIEAIPREWLTNDWLITDYSITDVNAIESGQAAKQYVATRALLSSYGLEVGTYISGTLVQPLLKQTSHYPGGLVPTEWMPPDVHFVRSWAPADGRKMIDVSDPATRAAFQDGIRKLWQQYPSSVKFVDNAAVHKGAGAAQPWSDYCQNIAEIGQLAKSMNAMVIFNIAAHIGELSQGEREQLMLAVGHNGIMLEMPWVQSVQKDPAATERAIKAYRQILDSGAAIIMAPPGAEVPASLVAWVQTWRKPGDRIYFAGAFYLPPNSKLYGSGTSH